MGEINRPFDLSVACLAECNQIRVQRIPLVAVYVVESKHGAADSILGSAQLATPPKPSPHLS